MHVLRGKSISPGYGRGKAFIYDPFKAAALPHRRIARGHVSSEYERFHRAVEKSAAELQAVEKKVFTELGRAEAAIFSAHLAMLKDATFIRKVKERIARDLVNVEHALEQEIADLTRLLSEVESEYVRERAKDLQDIGRRVLRHLGHGPQHALKSLARDTVLVTKELLPSDTLDLDRRHLAAFVTERGGGTSHAAILARSLGIPAVTGIEGATDLIPGGAVVLVDGVAGTVTVGPTHDEVTVFRAEKRQYDAETARADEAEWKESVTLDGVEVRLMANVGRPEEAGIVLKHNLGGVGLFRTEYLFLRADHPPDRDFQAAVYSRLAARLSPRPVTIRTLDLGGDKKPSFLESRFEHNPSLGARGLRFSLAERDLLRVQLEAIVKSNARGNVRVLFPMVLGEDDLRAAIGELRAAADRVGSRRLPPVGAMIETPSALFELEEILSLADFVSIGTNDLVQFMLAADRSATDLAGEDMMLHPSVLRAISRVVEAARGRGRSVSVCGEAAGDPRMACLLVGLGIRELSMSPLRAARVRTAICANSFGDLQTMARRALESKAPEGVRKIIDRIAIGTPQPTPPLDVSRRR